MKKKKTWLGILISLFFLYLAFHKSDWGQIWRVAKEVDPILILASLPFLLVSFWWRGVRWRYLLWPTGRPSLTSLFGAVMIGFMSLNILPLRIGEFVRAYVLGRREKISKSAVFATIVIERVFDGFTLLLLLIISIWLLPLSLSPKTLAWIRAFSYLALAVYLGALAFLIVLKVKTELTVRLFERAMRFAPRFQSSSVKIIRSFAGGLDVLSNTRLVLIISFYSLLVWLASAAFFWMTMFAFHSPGEQNLGLHVGFLGTLLIVGIISLAIIIPSGPGFVGTYELACIMALIALGVNQPLAESFAIISHALNFLPVTLLGLVCLYVQDFSLRDIKDGAETTQAELDPE